LSTGDGVKPRYATIIITVALLLGATACATRTVEAEVATDATPVTYPGVTIAVVGDSISEQSREEIDDYGRSEGFGTDVDATAGFMTREKQEAAESAPPGRRADRERRRRALGRLAQGEVRVREQGTPLRLLDQQVPGMAAAVAHMQHDVLAERVGAVSPGGVGGERENCGDLLVGQVIGDPDLRARRRHSAGSRSVAAVAMSRPSSWRGGTNRYPTLRTVPMRPSCSAPSLARRRRTWTSTVRVPPK